MDLNVVIAPVFEWGEIISQSLADAIFGLKYYPVLGVVLLSVATLGISFYYFPGGAFKAKISKWYHWLIWNIAVAAIAGLIITLLARNNVELSFPGTIQAEDYLMLFLVTVIDSLVFTGLVLSNLLRWFSTDLKSTPFPQ